MPHPCTKCPLGTPGIPVMPSGPRDASIVFLGEAPGAEEVMQGVPFVGKSGTLLRTLAKSAGLNLEEVLILNAVWCRPPDNRDPVWKAEMQVCWQEHVLPILQEHPRTLIVPLGRFALRAVAGKAIGIQSVAGRPYPIAENSPLAGVPGTPQVFPMLHPAATMHDEAKLPAYKQDWRALGEFIASGMKQASYDVQVRVLSTVEEVLHEFKLLADAPLIAVDTETGGFDFQHDPLVCYSFCCQKGRAIVLPILWKDAYADPAPRAFWSPQDWAQVHLALRKLLENPDVTKVAHNGKFDSKFIWFQQGIRLRGFRLDTMLMHHLIDENASQGLKALAKIKLRIPEWESGLLAEHKAACKYHKVPEKSAGYDIVSSHTLCQYAGIDAEVTWRLAKLFADRLKRFPAMWRLFENWVMPVQQALQSLEEYGVLVCPWTCDSAAEQLSALEQEAQQAVVSAFGREVSPTNPNDRRKLLIDECGLPVLECTEGGAPCVSKEVLATLRNPDSSLLAYQYSSELKRWNALPQCPVSAEQFASWRQYAPAILELQIVSRCRKWANDYVRKTQSLVSPYDGRVHTRYNMARDDRRSGSSELSGSGARSGRISSSCPNLQQVPEEVRAIFVAPPGSHVFAADYSQAEVRVLAAYCRDPNLLAVCKSGEDIHTLMAANMHGIALTEVTKAQRRAAKRVTFGIMYGDVVEPPLMELFYQRFPGVMPWVDSTLEFARKHGYVDSMFGRRRRLPDIDHLDQTRRRHAENQARNFPIQETASTITLAGLVNLVNASKRLPWHFRPMLTVHDENVGEYDVDHHDEMLAVVHECMTDPLGPIGVDMPLDVETWPCWEGELQISREKVIEDLEVAPDD